MAPGDKCSLEIEIESEQSGYANIIIDYTYFDGNNIMRKTASAYVVYIKEGNPAKLTINTIYGSLVNMIPGTTATQIIRVTNTGTSKLTNLAFTTSNTNIFKVTGIGTTPCINQLTNLAMNEYCDLVVGYNVASNASEISGFYKIIIITDFINTIGLCVTLINDLQYPYSIITKTPTLFFR
jgi:hypothetical protein